MITRPAKASDRRGEAISHPFPPPLSLTFISPGPAFVRASSSTLPYLQAGTLVSTCSGSFARVFGGWGLGIGGRWGRGSRARRGYQTVKRPLFVPRPPTSSCSVYSNSTNNIITRWATSSLVLKTARAELWALLLLLVQRELGKLAVAVAVSMAEGDSVEAPRVEQTAHRPRGRQHWPGQKPTRLARDAARSFGARQVCRRRRSVWKTLSPRRGGGRRRRKRSATVMRRRRRAEAAAFSGRLPPRLARPCPLLLLVVPALLREVRIFCCVLFSSLLFSSLLFFSLACLLSARVLVSSCSPPPHPPPSHLLFLASLCSHQPTLASRRSPHCCAARRRVAQHEQEL